MTIASYKEWERFTIGDGVMVNFEMFRGDTLKIKVDVTDEHGDPVDIEDYVFRFTVKTNLDDEDVDAVFQKGNESPLTGITITNETLGKVEVIIDPIDTTSCEDYLYYYDLEMVNDTNTSVKTLLYGRLRVKLDITATPYVPPPPAP